MWFQRFLLSTAWWQALGWRCRGGSTPCFVLQQFTDEMKGLSWTVVGVLLDLHAIPVKDKERRSRSCLHPTPSFQTVRDKHLGNGHTKWMAPESHTLAREKGCTSSPKAWSPIIAGSPWIRYLTCLSFPSFFICKMGITAVLSSPTGQGR